MVKDFSEVVQACVTVEDVKSYFKDEIEIDGYTASACGAFLPTDKGPEPHFSFWTSQTIGLSFTTRATSLPTTTL